MKRRTFLSTAVVAMAILAVIALACRLRRRYVSVTVRGESMEPTLRLVGGPGSLGVPRNERAQYGDRVLADRTRVGDIRVGDVVVLEPGRPRQDLAMHRSRTSIAESTNGQSSTTPPSCNRTAYWMIKRVVAVPGDPVPRGSVPSRHAAPNAVVPRGRLVVIGDNASASSDSRQLGYFRIEQVLGVVRR
jgi:signal peptidase I